MLVAREQGVVQQVRVGEDDVGVLADPAALVGGGVAVVGGGPHARDGQRLDAGELVGGEGLGGRDVEDGGAATGRRGQPVDDRGQPGDEVAQALARGRAGRQHDVGARVGEVHRLSLVRPRLGDAAAREAGQDGRGDPLGPLGDTRGTGREVLDVTQPRTAVAGRECGEDRSRLGRCRHGGYRNAVRRQRCQHPGLRGCVYVLDPDPRMPD